MNYIGDYVEDFSTLNFKFLTEELAGNTASIPVTLAGTPVISIYQNGSLVQSVAGVTLIVDYDGITGLNDVVVDLSSDVFYAPAKDYQAVITVGTISGNSTVGRVVATFSIENRSHEKILARVSNITTGAAAAAVSATAAVLTTGTEVNTYASTHSLDGGYHEITDVGGVIDLYYDFDIGPNNTGSSVAMNGRLEGVGDILGVYAYDWAAGHWDKLNDITGTSATTPDSTGVFTLLDVHTGTGVNEGIVRIRGLASGLTSATLYLDRTAVRYAPVAAPTVVEIRAELDSNSTKLAAIIEDTGTTIPDALLIIDDFLDTEIAEILSKLVIVDTVVDGIQVDLSNTTDGLGALKALIDTLDTVSDAVKAKTDQLTFTKALELDTNTQSINGATVMGDGQATPWEGTV